MQPSDETPHAGTSHPNWVEAWLFDLVQSDRSLAASIELLIWPQLSRAAIHTSIVRAGKPLISLVDLAATAPKPPSLEVRAPGLWIDVGVQTPLDHVTVDIEAFAVALDDPDDVFRGAYGIRTAVGTELEWETADDPRPGVAVGSYEIPCTVHGELLIGDDVIEVDGWGWRSHRWGVPSSDDRTRIRGKAAGGQWIHEQTTDRELTMHVVGAAPAPDPTGGDGALRQFFAVNDAGDCAWVRRLDG